MPSGDKVKSRSTLEENGEIFDHVKVHIEAKENKKSAIPKRKRQIEGVPYYRTTNYNPYAQPAFPEFRAPHIENDYKPQVHVNIETEKRQSIPISRERRQLATEYTKNIMVPARAENNLGVVHQKRVEEDYENAGKRNKILKLDKRELYQQPMYWEPRATIRGNKAMKNPILQLLRAAAGQKTQRILGLNSKAFDIFPGPLPDDQNAAVNNNLGKVSSEAPTNQNPTSVDQQIMRTFRRPAQRRNPFMAARQLQAERMMSMYPQESQQQQQMREFQPSMLQQRDYAAQQQREYAQPPQQQQQQQQQVYAPPQQREYLQQREYAPQQEQQIMPQQEMSMQQQDTQQFMPENRQPFSGFSPFTAVQRHSFATPPSAFGQFREQQREMTQFPRQLRGEEVAPQEPQMFMKPSGYPMEQMQEMYRPQQMQEMSPQTRGLPQQYSNPSPSSYYRSRQESFARPSQRSMDAADATLRELQKSQLLPEMKYSEQSGILTDSSLEHSDLPEMIAQKAVSMSPLEESQKLAGGSISSFAHEEIPEIPMLSNKVFQVPGERQYLPEMPWLSNEGSNRRMYPSSRYSNFMHSSSLPMVNPRYFYPPPMPSLSSQRHDVASHIPRRPAHISREEDDDDFDEKPEVHVHIQTEKSHISKPTELMKASLQKPKKS